MKWAFGIFLWVLLSCQPTSTDPENILATVHDKKFTESALKGMFPNNFRPEDSSSIATTFIDHWVRKEVMLQEAEKSISSNIDIEQLVDDYRSSLILDNFEQKLIQEQFDTTVAETEVKEYYEVNKEQFLLKNDIVQCIYAEVPETSKKVEMFYEDWKSKNYTAIKKYCALNCTNSLLYPQKWYNQKELEGTLQDGFSKKVKWNKVGHTQTNSNDNEYFLWILGTKKKGEQAPLEYVKSKVVKILVHDRKKNLIKDFENKLLQREINNKNVILY